MSGIKLLDRINRHTAKIGVIGQGYVGLPLAIAFAKAGFAVTGLDMDKNKVNSINRGCNYLEEMGIGQDLSRVVKAGKLKATSSIEEGCRKQDVIIICVPTPINRQHQPDITLLKLAAGSIAACKPAGKLIVNESTVAPFTTQKIVGGIIRQTTGLIPGKDFYLGFSPERINPGDRQHIVENTPKIVSGVGDKDRLLVKTLYGQAIKAPLVEVSSPAVAESVKLLENSFRAVNIALVNELAKYCQKADLDVLEIIEAAKTKWSFMAHYPGIGVGGHCIPVDPYYLLDEAAGHGIDLPTLRCALKLNESMPKFVFRLLRKTYQQGQKILVYGLSYKAGVKDARESPAVEFCRILKDKKITFAVYDPYYTAKDIKRMGFSVGRLKKYDILLVATGHPQLESDSEKIVGKQTTIIDGRNFFKKKIGRRVIGIGRLLK